MALWLLDEDWGVGSILVHPPLSQKEGSFSARLPPTRIPFWWTFFIVCPSDPFGNPLRLTMRSSQVTTPGIGCVFIPPGPSRRFGPYFPFIETVIFYLRVCAVDSPCATIGEFYLRERKTHTS